MTTRWLFADQLGPHFIDVASDQQVLLIESTGALRRRRYHRAKAHLILSALRHRAAELGGRATLIRTDGYAQGVAQFGGRLTVCDPTTRAARALVRRLPDVEVLPSRGFLVDEGDFATWVQGRRRLVMEDFYRHTRESTGILMAGEEPVGGRWNFDHDNRQPPPRDRETLGLPHPWHPAEDDIDAEVREYLDALERSGQVSFIGRDGPRLFAVTRDEALTALDDFIRHRLEGFGPHEDAVMSGDWVMAHSLLSVPLNLGLLHPTEVVDAAVAALENGAAPLSSVEGFVRQVIGWREWMWHLYWHLGEDYADRNHLHAQTPIPAWFADCDADAVTARCLSHSLAEVRDRGWTHHIVRLMILSNWALQRGYRPREVLDWFHASFVDGFEWVMAANVIGMGLHADGGVVATKPYAGGGAYISRMTNLCRGCAYRPTERTGPRACPFTAGYWWFLERSAEDLRTNHRMAQPLAGLQRLSDRAELVRQEQSRGDAPP